jgi:hypothetical protein
MNIISFSITYRSPITLTATLFGIVAMLMVAYVYFVAAAVLAAVMHQDHERMATAVRSEIAELETTLITAQHTISNRLAAETDFAATEQKIFLERSSDTNVALTGTRTDN